MAGVSPTQNSLKLMRKRGYHVAICEYWNSFTNRRHDLFGVMDLIAFRKRGFGVIAIQTTSYTNVSARVNKIKEWDGLADWLSTGSQFHIHGWHKKKNRWVARELFMFQADYGIPPQAGKITDPPIIIDKEGAVNG